MKKIVTLVSMVVALGFIVGCGGSAPTPPAKEKPAASSDANANDKADDAKK